jgi:hypothetical protein
MNINRAEALPAVNNSLTPKQETSGNTTFSDLLLNEQSMQSSTTKSVATQSMATSPSVVDVSYTTAATESSVTDSSEAATAEQRNAVQEFRDYMAKSDTEKMRMAVLKELGLTEEELEQLPPEEQLDIEQIIVERLKERTGVSDIGLNDVGGFAELSQLL